MGRLSKRGLTLAATALGSALAFIDTTVVVVALPTIEEDLDLGLAGQQWVYLSYSLSLAALYLVSGALGDRYGRRETFIAGVLAFAAASALCGVAPTEGVLVAARFLQGIGGAVLTTNSLALLREVYGNESDARSASGRPSPAWRRSPDRRSAVRSPSGRRGAGSSSSTCRSPR
jgi:MFS family permease